MSGSRSTGTGTWAIYAAGCVISELEDGGFASTAENAASFPALTRIASSKLSPSLYGNSSDFCSRRGARDKIGDPLVSDTVSFSRDIISGEFSRVLPVGRIV